MSQNKSLKSISVIGLGKLGASMVAGMASRGFGVIGVDINQSAVDALNEGNAPVQETGLGEMLSDNRSRIRATMSYEEAILSSDISFVIVPTPSDERGAFSIQYAASAFKEIGKALKKKDGYHVIVLTSTVLPGATRAGLLPVLEKESGKKCGRDFGLCYSPEFIALGSVIRDFLNPDFYLVGEYDKQSGDMLEEVNSQVAQNKAMSKRMSIENAELAKIAINGFITLKVSYANMLADMCEHIPGGNVDIVSDALGMDSRIGRKYLTGGLGFGGPCFPRDNVALAFVGDMLGVSTNIPKANHTFNQSLAVSTVKKLEPYLNKNKKIAVLGLAYKPLSHVVDESPGVFLAKSLADAGYNVTAYDPLANDSARDVLKDHVLITDTIAECVSDAETILVTTTDEAYKNLLNEGYIGTNKEVTIIDFWRYLGEEAKSCSNINYVPMGVCLNEDESLFKLSSLWKL
jgi:UDPglucose 6-dehydrogenase